MVVQHSRGSYPVHFGEGMPELPAGAPLITDSNLAALYPELIANHPHMIVPAGEASKSLLSVGPIVSWLASQNVRRDQPIVALGGGVIGDLAGFVASIYMRGIPFIQVPTSLLAMVDSSVGGKVGVDLPEGKNLVGAFWPPAAVHIHPVFLHSLPDFELTNGLAEVAKMGAILDPALLESLQPDGATLAQIQRSVDLKRQCVEADEFERSGIRATLNFGHTIGHALEQVTDYEIPHGRAVAIGMIAETQLGEQLGHTPAGTADWLRAHLERLGLPTSIPAAARQPQALIQAMRRDKKVSGENLAFALLTARGACKLFADIPVRAVEELFNNIS
ncbi:MAG: 3-dehydroquinate synthase [Chthonomonas sp.]|nr:3-dehydroquinate synthase [Chthonomonas sp.]